MTENEKENFEDYKLGVKISKIIGKKLNGKNLTRAARIMLVVNYKLAKAIGSQIESPLLFLDSYVKSITKAIESGVNNNETIMEG